MNIYLVLITNATDHITQFVFRSFVCYVTLVYYEYPKVFSRYGWWSSKYTIMTTTTRREVLMCDMLDAML